MKALLEAIKAKYDASLSGTFTKLSGGVVKEGTAYPYVRYYVISSPVTGGFETNHNPVMRTVNIQFDIFGRGMTATLALADTFNAQFHKQVLSMSAGQNVQSWLRNDLIKPDGLASQQVGEDGDPVFHYVAEYEFVIVMP